MENNETIIRSVSIPLLTWRIAEKRHISLSKAVKSGIALALALDETNGEVLTDYEELLLQDSNVGEIKRRTAERVLKTLRD